MMELFFVPLPEYWPSTILAAVVGLLIGSFLNVVIHRTPKMMQRDFESYVATEISSLLDVFLRNLSAEKRRETKDLIDAELTKSPVHLDRYNIVLPRSACPHCGHQITAFENIPVFSYLFIRGKCTGCKAPVSIRYPLVELLTSGISAFLIWHFGSGLAGLMSVVFAWFLIAMTFIDADTQLLPDDLTLPLLWLGLIVNINGTFAPLHEAVIGAAAGYLSLWSIFWLFKFATGKDGMGYGDFKLLAALGAWMGWTLLPIIILLSSCVGALIGVTLIVMSKLGKNRQIPFGPYLAIAGLIALIWGKTWTAQYLGLYLG